jgi:hypothetical protein
MALQEEAVAHVAQALYQCYEVGNNNNRASENVIHTMANRIAVRIAGHDGAQVEDSR